MPALMTFPLIGAVTAALVAGPTQTQIGAPASADVLATVRIPVAVTAGGTLLPAGVYQLRLTQQPPGSALQPEGAQRAIEFVGEGKVVARDVAELLRDDDLPDVGASSQHVPNGVRVEKLKDDAFLRISVKRDTERYLVYLPVQP